MRIAVVNLTAGGFSGGYVRYLANILPSLTRDARVDSLDVYLPADKTGLVSDHPGQVRGWPRGSAAATRAWITSSLARDEPEVIFVPTARYLSTDIPIVTMVRNMEPLVAPISPLSPFEVAKNLLRRTAAHQACRRATRCIAVSEYVADYLRRHVEGARVDVVHHGAAPLPPPAPPHSAVGERFLFTAGSIRPARNLEDIIDAFALLDGPESRDLRLVIGGSSGSATKWYERSMRRRASAAGVEDRVRWVGQLSDAQMAWCYANCAAFVMTSRIEACPNTVLESMISKTPSISIELAPMTELYGDAALYYQPGHPGSLRTQLQRILTDRGLQETLGAATFKRAHRFTWERTATLTVDVLEQSIRQRGDAEKRA